MSTITSNFSLKSRSLKFKWTFGASAAIFLTFFLFSYAIYQGIGQMFLNEENQKVNALLISVSSSLKEPDLVSDEQLVEALNKDINISKRVQDQIISIYNESGNLLSKASFMSSRENAKHDFTKYFHESSEIITTKPTLGGKKIIISQQPIVSSYDNSTIIGYVQVANPLTSYNKIMNKLLIAMIILGAVALLISGMLGYLLAQNFLSPLTKLARTMNNIRKNGFQKRIDTSSKTKDEIGELTVIFNDMMKQIETSFEQQKQFVEDASHELRTPVQIMEGHLNLLNRWGKNDPSVLDESLDASLTELGRMKKLVQEMLDLSRAEQISQTKDLQVTNINATVAQVRRNFEILYENFTFNLTEKDESLYVFIQHNHLEQLLIIIMDNAVKYSLDERTIDICVFKEEKKVKISIRDYGIGISKNEINKVFNRFYRVDKARSREQGGNGLGLAIAKQLVEGYLGSITAVSEPEKGTTITITLPLIDKEDQKAKQNVSEN